jgi:hypothetical protein
MAERRKAINDMKAKGFHGKFSHTFSDNTSELLDTAMRTGGRDTAMRTGGYTHVIESSSERMRHGQ